MNTLKKWLSESILDSDFDGGKSGIDAKFPGKKELVSLLQQATDWKELQAREIANAKKEYNVLDESWKFYDGLAAWVTKFGRLNSSDDCRARVSGGSWRTITFITKEPETKFQLPDVVILCPLRRKGEDITEMRVVENWMLGDRSTFNKQVPRAAVNLIVSWIETHAHR